MRRISLQAQVVNGQRYPYHRYWSLHGWGPHRVFQVRAGEITQVRMFASQEAADEDALQPVDRGVRRIRVE